MKSLYKFSAIKILISVILVIVALIFLAPIIRDSFLSSIGVYITPDRTFGIDLKGLENMRDIYGVVGAKVYFKTRFIYDLIWMFIYIFFMINVYAFLLRGLEFKLKSFFMALPFMVFLFDLLENSFCSLYFFNGNSVLGYIGLISSNIKWYLLIFVLTTYLMIFMYRLYNKYIEKRKRKK